MRSIVERNLPALVTFVVAALVLGVPVGAGLACLLAFGLAAVVARGVQRRRHVVEARAARPAQRRPPARSGSRPRPPKVVVDDAESYGWPRLST